VRILLLSDFYPPHVGGVELQVAALAEEFVLRGHVVDVGTVWQEGLPAETDDAGIRVHRLRALATRGPWFSSDPRRRFHPPFPDPELAVGLRRLVARVRPDVVQAHGWIAYSYALASLGRDVPFVLSVRDYGYTCATRNMLLRGKICPGPTMARCLRHTSAWYGQPKGIAATLGVRIGRALLRRQVTAVHAVSRYVGEVVGHDLMAGRDREIALIPDVVLGVPDAEPDAAGVARVTERLPDRPYILFVGALQPHKGLAPLLAAYEALADPPPLVLIGTTWPDTPERFPGGVTVIADAPHAGVIAAWERAIFGVAPSIWPDPLPGVIREAMASGRPVIGSRIGGIVDIIADGENGLLVTPGDAEELAAAMRRLIEDPALTERLGTRAAESVAPFEPVLIATQFELLYRRISPSHGEESRDPAAGLPAGASRIHITGGSGTGKSSLAARLSVATGIPRHHLDEIVRAGGEGSTRSLEERRARVHEIAGTPAWITEGIHVGWTEELFREADVIVWLDQRSWRRSAGRVVRRFVAGWLAENRRGGVAHLFRSRSYGRHLRDLVTAVRDIRRYETAAQPTVNDSGNRNATLEQVRPYGFKLVRCRNPSDLDEFVASVLAGSAPGTGPDDPRAVAPG
jgi:glycosyltransferase involved in cell wall biosynthesis